MQDTGTEDGEDDHHRQHHFDTEITESSDNCASSGPLSGSLSKRSTGARKSARSNIPDLSASAASDDQAYEEISLDVRDDSVAVHSVKTAGGGDVDDQELAFLAKALERTSSFGSSTVQNASSRVKQVSQELRRLASLTKRAQPGRSDRNKSSTAHALKGLAFISKIDGDAGWAAVEKRFDNFTASTNGLLHSSQFGECIGVNKDSKDFSLELFDALARRLNISGDSINKDQLSDFWDQIADQSFDSRLRTFFDMVDNDADGRITEEQVREIISLSASANKLPNLQKHADEYAALIMEELDPGNLGYVMIENLEMLLLQAPEENKSQMLSQKLRPTKIDTVRRWTRETKYFVLDNWQRVWVMLLWFGAMAGLFAWKYIQYRNRSAYGVMRECVCLAKGAAETLKLNMALILLPVCRSTITWLRNKTKLGVAVPFDDNLNFHQLIGIAISIGVGIHAISHLACDFPRLLSATPDEYEPMKEFFGDQPKSYWHFVRSFEWISGIIMVVLMTIAFTLASPWFKCGRVNLPKFLKKLSGFNAFWFSHHLFVIVYGLLIAHGIKLYLTKEWCKKTTWMYLTIPVVLYACERLVRAFRSSIKPVKIQKVAVYPGNVLALHMSKPQGFKYKSGQYMFVNCAAVSPFEWHPFSITSAPGDDRLSVHIRTSGDWTRQLLTVFLEVGRPPPRGLLRDDLLRGENKPNFPRVLIDGPYGTPAHDYKKYDVVLLVGLEIVATPMISIVMDIVNNMKVMEEEENALESGNRLPASASPVGVKKKSGSGAGNNFRTRRAYFYWVTREQGSFDWFKGIMNEVAELDNKGVIEMHNYCTGEGDARSALVTMLQSLNHAKNSADIVSGTRVKSHFGKPSWRNVYKRITLNHTNDRVGVFYCGAPALTKELKHLASDFTHRTSTRFDFHREQF